MVRRPAALLGALAAAQAYVLLAPELPVIASDDLGRLVAAAAGTAAVFLIVAAVAPLSDDDQPAALLPAVVAAALVAVAVLNLADVGAAATPAEAVLYGGAGALLATGLLSPALALGLPVFVAAIDLVSTLTGGPSALLSGAATHAGDPLSLEMPAWGSGLSAGRLGLSDPVLAAVLIVFARRFGLRPVATAVGLWAATVAAIGLQLAVDGAVPVIPFMAAAYFLVNADRLGPLLARARQG